LRVPVSLCIQNLNTAFNFDTYEIKHYKKPGYLSGISLGCGMDDRESQFREVLGIIILTTESRPDLGPTQPPIQWVPGALSLGVKQPRRDADQSHPSCGEVKNAWSYTSILIHLHVFGV